MLSLAAALRQVKLSGCGRAGAEGSRRMLDFAIERGAIKGELPKANHWSASAAWRAVVRDALIAEWQAYADNQRARKTMWVQNP